MVKKNKQNLARAMEKTVVGISPLILKWARERSGYSLEDVSLVLKKTVEVIKGWESGESAPTYGQLEKIAYQLYKRPIAIFFFPAPPDEPDPKQSFRTLPEFEIENLSTDTLYALRQAKAMQLALREINGEINPAERKIFSEIQVHANTDSNNLAGKVRNFLRVPLDEQMQWKSNEEALKNWRRVIEDCGIFVFKRSFKQRDVSGFCLMDEEFPVIYLNNSTAATRQIFSLFHELSHILLQTNGITKTDDQYIDSLTGKDKEIEIFCNQFPADFLVPSQDFERWLKQRVWNDESISRIADSYKVSREVILRKLLDNKRVTRDYYEMKSKEWTKEWEDSRQGRGGGTECVNENETQVKRI